MRWRRRRGRERRKNRHGKLSASGGALGAEPRIHFASERNNKVVEN